eukprot:CAMPEP_0117002376 /NCGR_PEP_ID=MMETSP0472-20121206/4073_1 /TAXON_ID=693140 ORGANISM="Tiarina fusus, Strain LIS" /NCGR_SAMPLE_ID=MMETSP0472 /ASSEMBLY_ACC=CAM_ASM_000603 /LENGTH=1327 /DNA_ID=CAMNT_0004702717 /DNA_START=12 /DNA_END=3995 /DNA_ORIENTATION=-
MADAPKVAVKKYKVKVATAPSLPPKPSTPVRPAAARPVSTTVGRGGPPPARGAAAAAFAAQQQKQQQALLRQQQAYAQQRAQQQYQNLTPQQRAQLQYQQQVQNMTPQQRAQLQYQQQLRQQQMQQQQMQQQQLQQQQLRQQQMRQQQALRAQQGGAAQPQANSPQQQQAAYQAQLRQQMQRQGSKNSVTPSLPAVPGNIPPPAAPTTVAQPNLIPLSQVKPTSIPLPTPPTPATTGPPPSVPKKPPTIPSKPAEKPEPKSNAPSKPRGKEIELHWPTDKTPFEQPDEPSRIVYEQKEDDFSKAKIKAASIEKLVEKATMYNADAILQKTLLLTYRSMISSDGFLNLLMERFSMPLPDGNEASVEAFKAKKQKPIQVRICQLIKTWITKYFDDFQNNQELLAKLSDFCSNTIKPVCPPGATLESIIQRQVNGEYEKSKEIQFTEPPPEPILPKVPRPSFLDIHPMEIARQLTIIESQLYRAILPQECLGLAWSKKNAQERSPNILKMINRFNIVSNWVCSEILKQETQKQRVDTLNHFIEIAERCKGLNNFNACMEIISGLGDSSVHRLKNHWAELPKKTQTLYNELKVILSSEQSYKNFRAYLKTCNGACIPYLGMYLTDLTFIEDGNQDKLGELHNFSKRIFVSNVIQEIQQYQQSPYILKTVPAIHNFFNSLEEKVIDKEKCYQISLQILPRGGAKAAPSPAPQKKQGDDYGEMQDIPGYPFNTPDTSKNIHLQKNPNDPSGPPKVAAGTLEKIVERITYKTFPEAQLLSAFLLTYRTYTTGKELLDLLIMRFNMPLPTDSAQLDRFKREQLLPVQLRVLNVLKNWVEYYPYDFVADKALAVAFFDFVNTNSSMHAASLKRIAKTLKQRTGNAKDQRRNTIAAGVTPAVMPLQAGADPKNLTFLDFHPVEVARQICMFDFSLLSAIQPLEMLDRIWESDHKRARNLIQLIRRVSAMKNWVVHQVIDVEASLRRKMLTQLVAITTACYDLHNFHSVIGLLQGLQCPEVNSLAQTWESIDSATMDKLKTIQSIGNNLTSLRVFREHALQNCQDEPAIFPLEGYLNEIEVIEDQDDSYTGELLNMMKNRKLSVTINEFLSTQNNPYCFELVPFLQTYIRDEITSYADRDGLSDQVPLSEQIAAMSIETVKMGIKSGMTDDPAVKSELLKALKKALLSEIASEELQAFTDHTEEFKQKMRQELQTAHEKFARGPLPEQDSEAELSKKFGADLDTLEDWILEDQEGTVYGWPEQIVVPTLSTSDGQTYLVYQKKIFDKAELALALRVLAFYQQYSGCESTPRIIAVSHFIAPNTRRFAEQSGVELLCVA